MRLCLSAAVMGGKLSSKLSTLVGGRGSTLPGMVASKIYPHTLNSLASQVRDGVIMVIGTNGKTTTNNMIAKVLQGTDKKIVFNKEGANMLNGVTACFVRAANFCGQIDFDYAILEVDEATFPKVVQQIKPRFVVITNFFRDQLDRYGKLDNIVNMIRKALNQLEDVTLILNADDPLVANLGRCTGHNAVYYGVAQQQDENRPVLQTGEACFCPHCGAELQYNFLHYSQLGDYYCTQCDFSRPQPDVEVVNVSTHNQLLHCEFCHGEDCVNVTLYTTGFYNIYNALAAFALGRLLDVDISTIKKGLESYTPIAGRLERFRYQNKLVVLNLVKNPAGLNEGLATLLAHEGTKDLFIAINDHPADGRDVSWLWDVDFEILVERQCELLSFICAGTRAEEVALRLKYAGVPVEKITVVNDLETAISNTLQGSADSGYLFSAYTALWPTRVILSRLAEKEETHAVGLSSLS